MAVDVVEVPAFARGYVLSEERLEPPVAGWSTESVLGLSLTRAPEATLTQARSGGSSVIVVGHLVDTHRWLPQDAAVVAAADALARSEREFLDLTDAWSGRYLLLYGVEGTRWVTTDASGMRSAFYALEGPFVLGSHARLVARIVGAPDSSIVDDYLEVKQVQPPGSVPPMPGRVTPWTGVVALTANQALEVGTRQLRRIFPRGPLPTMDLAAASAVVAPRLRGQVESLVASGHPIALSVTAGRDTRVSLAASRSSRKVIEYFTYRRTGLTRNDWDVETAASMAAALGLRHRVLEIPAVDEQRRIREPLADSTITTNGRAYVGAYRVAFAPDTFHIRSNVGEIARGYYRRHSPGREMDAAGRKVTPDMLALLWGHGAPVSSRVVEAFDDWMQAVGFADVEGMDALDVLYWEHRMACWHANVVLASDFAFETHVLFNARTILQDMLAVPLEDRVRSRLFKRLATDLWPELGRWRYREPAGEDPPSPVGRSRAHAIRRRLGRLVAR